MTPDRRDVAVCVSDLTLVSSVESKGCETNLIPLNIAVFQHQHVCFNGSFPSQFALTGSSEFSFSKKIITSPVGAVEKYCDEHVCVCVSVCLSVRKHTSGATCTIFTRFL